MQEGIGCFNVALCGNHGRFSVAPALDIAVPRPDIGEGTRRRGGRSIRVRLHLDNGSHVTLAVERL